MKRWLNFKAFTLKTAALFIFKKATKATKATRRFDTH